MENRLYTLSGSPLNGVVEGDLHCAALIPCFNEAGTIGPLVLETRKFVEAVWVVDDASSDDTSLIAETAGANVIRNERNEGKGACLQHGLNSIADAGYQFAVCLDGDGQHGPADIPTFLKASGDLVIGNRMEDAAKMTWLRRFINRWTSARISNRVGFNVPDSQCGMRLIRLAAWQKLRLQETRFVFESEMLIKFSRANLKISFVPIRCLPARRPSRIHPLADTYRWFRWWLRS